MLLPQAMTSGIVEFQQLAACGSQRIDGIAIASLQCHMRWMPCPRRKPISSFSFLEEDLHAIVAPAPASA